MSPLKATDFPAFFKALWGYCPFPWQERLALQVALEGGWPPLLDLPTGAGKTAAIDIAVFHLALDAEPEQVRRAPLRVLFVVDRRLVVDDACRRARHIAGKLDGADGGVLKAVADRLRALSGGGPPLMAARLRGGMPQEGDWARSAAQPTVLTATVDQVGSRLLFRGYGVSPRMAPVHAGLMGADALWLLDEAHLSNPFVQILRAIAEGHRTRMWNDADRITPFQAVTLTATPGTDTDGAFSLGEADRAHPVLGPRLTAVKTATLRRAPTGQPVAAVAEVFAGAAAELLGAALPPDPGGARPVRSVAVVVNRVALARAVFAALRSRWPEDGGTGPELALVIGRSRPLDRDRLVEDCLGRVRAGVPREPDARPLIVVATQAVEAGADLDFDALVTEVAPLDSLRQRFGRLDRLGTLGRTRAVIVVTPGDGEVRGKDPIYGEALAETAKWLAQQGEAIDFGILAMNQRLDILAAAEAIDTCLAPKPDAPVLFPAYVSLWATTSPLPAADPDPALFLHGAAPAGEVQIVWRADLTAEDLAAPQAGSWCRALLEACPPSALEAIALPLSAARAFLAGNGQAADAADVPSDIGLAGAADAGRARPALRWSSQAPKVVRARDLRPGDVLVVPAAHGGADAWGWNPSATGDPVRDLGTEAHFLHRRKGAVRVHRAVLQAALVAEGRSDDASGTDEVWNRIRPILASAEEAGTAALITALLAVPGLPRRWDALLRAMPASGVRRVDYHPADPTRGLILHAKAQLRPDPDLAALFGQADEGEGGGLEAVTETERSVYAPRPVALTKHLRRVREEAAGVAARLGLAGALAEAVSLAAELHDAGKAERRFQARLRGSALRALRAHERLAKGTVGGVPRGPDFPPEGFRHEALSVALAAEHPQVKALDAPHRDLVLWLIGTHHGYGRPFFPPLDDPELAEEVRLTLGTIPLAAPGTAAPLWLDSGWCELAERVRRQFGPWDLAWLEAILRLADHRVSEAHDRESAEQPVQARPPEERRQAEGARS